MMSANDFRAKLQECLGGPWPEPCDLKPRLRETIRKEGYRIESVTYEAEPGDAVPAMLLVPDGIDANHPAPAVALCHQHNGEWHLGKTEPAGLAGNPAQHTGVALVQEGYVVLCPDALCFEERQSPHLKGGDFERFEFLRYVVAGKCMAWKNILDLRRGIDYLCQRPEVIRDRLGGYGHSMGSTHTWLVGPWEPRLKCLVGNCCLPSYAAIHRTHLLHCFPNFIPGLFSFGGKSCSATGPLADCSVKSPPAGAAATGKGRSGSSGCQKNARPSTSAASRIAIASRIRCDMNYP